MALESGYFPSITGRAPSASIAVRGRSPRAAGAPETEAREKSRARDGPLQRPTPPEPAEIVTGLSEIAGERPEDPGQVSGNPVADEVRQEEREDGSFGPAREELSEEEKREVERLAKRDRQVRAHEQAHLNAAGPYARSGPHYEYETGPDKRQYAVGGEVDIDTSPVSGDPEATIRKAQTVRRAALAPAEPSPQDRRVAAEASRMEARARQELARERTEERRRGDESGGLPPAGRVARREQFAGTWTNGSGNLLDLTA